MIYLGTQGNPDEQPSSLITNEALNTGYPATSIELLGSITAKVAYYREFPEDLDPAATHDAAGNKIIVTE